MTSLLWIEVFAGVGGCFLLFVIVTAVCFYRRARHYAAREKCYKDTVARMQEADACSSTQKKRTKKGGVASADTVISVPPSPAAAAIPVSVAGPYHYYTDPTKYTYDMFFSSARGSRFHGNSGSGRTSRMSSAEPSAGPSTTGRIRGESNQSDNVRREEAYTTSNTSQRREAGVDAAGKPAAVVTS
ncbi:putative transmembrane protein [Toxoplasma gondii TgCatPRC2]|nr:hypothetical protein TGME49_268980 [Toxoplasma gondii ME49]KFG52469.1 putative transmembrane protein [Toxoplasma gondii p89]KFH06215.1 putative transmembrane protein [Toxoplasma gondii VAND]KFH16825.1 putative transmembrane protein [Toxoplasma gondii MAS]KYF47127.1 hypothetical protein TGARI_268980 [Toxoplasma gondii ARI]KYK70866.1 putative transmembrane protein [Toxoplasma gondii TgCatPRC2]PIM01027.1 putative transmembrane protein [Toxoplasma gondii COUG]PUA87721.1 putative transmembrane|eukprot:XP_018636560.1 hypothetical protein TGME49_268980 [Toxoplasma gondii ME49]